MILDEEIDPSYEPTEDEIINYAKYLGLNIKTDQQYFYLARDGLKVNYIHIIYFNTILRWYILISIGSSTWTLETLQKFLKRNLLY